MKKLISILCFVALVCVGNSLPLSQLAPIFTPKPAPAGGGGGGSIAKVFSTHKYGASGDCTTPSVDITGCTLLTAVVLSYRLPQTFTDALGNTWVGRTNASSSGITTGLYDCVPVNLGSDTFSASGDTGLEYFSVWVFGWSGTSGSPYVNSSAAVFGGASLTFQPGAVTAKLFVCSAAWDTSSTVSVDSSFTLEGQGVNDGGVGRFAAAYKIESGGSSASENPTWTSGTGSSWTSILGGYQ